MTTCVKGVLNLASSSAETLVKEVPRGKHGGIETRQVAQESESYLECIIPGPVTPRKHKDPKAHGFWNPPCLGP